MKDDINDLMEADCWAHMVDVPKCTNEQLRARFATFSMRAKEMLLNDWENVSGERMKEVVEILKESMK